VLYKFTFTLPYIKLVTIGTVSCYTDSIDFSILKLYTKDVRETREKVTSMHKIHDREINPLSTYA